MDLAAGGHGPGALGAGEHALCSRTSFAMWIIIRISSLVIIISAAMSGFLGGGKQRVSTSQA